MSQVWKTQQWPQDWKRSVFITIPKKGNAKECSDYRTITLISHASKIMLKILQAQASLVAQMVKNLPAMQDTQGAKPSGGDGIPVELFKILKDNVPNRDIKALTR